MNKSLGDNLQSLFQKNVIHKIVCEIKLKVSIAINANLSSDKLHTIKNSKRTSLTKLLTPVVDYFNSSTNSYD